MGKIAGLDRSGVTQKRFFQRSSPPPSVSNDPFISLNAPSLVVYQFFIQRKTQNTPILSAAPPQGQQEPEENTEREPEERQPAGQERRDMGGTVTWHRSLLSI